MRLGVSTTGLSVKVLRKLREKRIPDFFELGISSSSRAERIVRELRDDIATIHALPFLKEEEKKFMFNPCADPAGAADVADRMAYRATENGLSYEVYGVHAGLLGAIHKPGVFKVSGRIGFEEGLKNLRSFEKMLNADRIILENIYGWDENSPAIGMTDNELVEMALITPLLLDLGHAAVNMEHYKNLSLGDLALEGLDVREVHVSFVKFEGAPPWDHSGYSRTPINEKILSKLAELTSSNQDLPVVLEIEGGFENVKMHLNLIRHRIEEL